MLIFPGVGSFGAAISSLHSKGYFEPLRKYLESGKPFFGICVGMQVLFEGSDEDPGIEGLGVFKGLFTLFNSNTKSVPHIGWNGATCNNGGVLGCYYFVHSFALMTDSNTMLQDTATVTDYGGELFVSSVKNGNTFAVQFHPEKSGKYGLQLIKQFITRSLPSSLDAPLSNNVSISTKLSKRIIPCLDVRSDDDGKLVVTKGDQYNVRSGEDNKVRNMGDPVQMALKYYQDGADEITFLNITGYKNPPLEDLPMLQLLRDTSKDVFVPLTVGGGIKTYKTTGNDGSSKDVSSLEVADQYFKAGADKVSLGSDAVFAAELFYKDRDVALQTSSIAQISRKYGKQAVVISVDPVRVYVKDPNETTHQTTKTSLLGPNGEEFVWFQCTVNGGRSKRDIDVCQLIYACEKLGAGEFLLNSIDKDGSKSGFDTELLSLARSITKLPIIASSGAGTANHFIEAFKEGKADAALAAGIFHREEVKIIEVKEKLKTARIEVRI